ncbi:MAG: CRTAC1 family protein [Bacteroidetes bacterium]|nr:CRTAC1 family protein [Bacteroidota bacterium]
MRDVFHRFTPLLLLAALAGGGLSCSPESTTTSAAQSVEHEGQTVVFTDVTEAAGLGAFRHENGAVGKKWYPEMMGSGGGFIDYDGDGWLDVLLMGGGHWNGPADPGYRALWLYRNNGDGTFSDRTEEARLADVVAYTIGFAAADYDNDGDQDFVLMNLDENMLFRNEGGVFTEVGKQAGLSEHNEWGSSALFFDADRDGHLDLYAGNYVDWSPETDKFCPPGGVVKLYCIPANYDGIPSRYYRNNGDGTFADRTTEAGFLAGIEPARDKTLGVAEADVNNDGWPDLFVANDTERDQLYENNGDGAFTEKGIRSGIAFDQHGKPRAGMGIDVGVVDSSGQPSMFVGNFSDETVGVYRYTGGGLFMDRAQTSKIGHPSLSTLTFGLFLFDADLDTDLDLFVANGHVQTHIERMVEGVTFRQRAQLFLNQGNGLFDEVTPADGPFTQEMVARGAAYADYDQDGDLDILITENNGPAHLWRNDTAGGHFLRVRLEGRASNRDALGARVVVVVGDLKMERRIRTGSSYLSQSETVAVFGLGNALAVDTLVVTWPSGRVDRFADVDANQELRIIEGAGTFERVPIPAEPGGV